MEGNDLLLAVLNVLEGAVIRICYPFHRNQEFIKFLRKFDRETPRKSNLQIILRVGFGPALVSANFYQHTAQGFYPEDSN